MIYFTAHTFKCVCHCIRSMFGVLGVYNFALASKMGQIKKRIQIIILDDKKSLIGMIMRHYFTLKKRKK